MRNKIFGDYDVIKQIGQGSLGTVYLAEHRFMKRPYVLKVLPEEFATDRGFIQRFEEGVAYLAHLEHPNIVKIHNISYAEGCYFLVMDCVVDSLGETTNLSQYLANMTKPLQEDVVYSLLMQVADALDTAHKQKAGSGMLMHHRLKLSNILVGSDRQNLHVLLSDFGLAPIVGLGVLLSRTYRMLVDTLVVNKQDLPAAQTNGYFYDDPIKSNRLHESFLQNYMFLAPEQKTASGALTAGPAADVYAFGVLAYFVMMKEYPEGVFPMPSERFPGYHCDWDRLITQCLQKSPGKRPSDLVALLEDIKHIKEEPVELPKMQAQVAQKIEVPVQIPVVVSATSQVLPPKAAAQPVKQQVLSAVGAGQPVLKTGELKKPAYDGDPGAIFRGDLLVTEYQPAPKETKVIEPIFTDMAIINGGEHSRGSKEGNRDEMPRHRVFLDTFAIDIHPVTNEQFNRFLEALGGEKDSNNNDIIRLRDSRIRRTGGKLSIESGYAKHPVVGVTWYGAVAYVKWIGKRLPTEAEWEIACCGVSGNSLFPTGDNIEKSQSNFFSSDTTAVMSYATNSYGLYDMVGNVYEWCQDWYGYNYYEISQQEPENPKGPLQGVYRVLRGGCWKSLKEDLRCSHRHRNNPGTVNSTYGFRCAADVN